MLRPWHPCEDQNLFRTDGRAEARIIPVNPVLSIQLLFGTRKKRNLKKQDPRLGRLKVTRSYAALSWLPRRAMQCVSQKPNAKSLTVCVRLLES